MWIIAVIMLIAALFLITVAVVFSVGGEAPSLFGYNIYLVKTDAFSVVANGDAIITEKVNPDEISSGNIVIFSNSDRTIIGEMQSSALVEGIYSFSVKDENGGLYTLTQSQIIGKAMYVSPILGTVVSFVSSPLGLLMIAVIPCFIIILFEIYKLFHKDDDEPIIEPIRKQDEIPTYIPKSKSVAVNAYKSSVNGNAEVEKQNVSRGDFSAANVDDLPKYAPYKRGRQSNNNDDVLFTGPQRKKQTDSREQMPLSQKKLNEAIAATKAEHRLAEEKLAAQTVPTVDNVTEKTDLPAAKPKEQPIQAVNDNSEKEETVKTYSPKPQPRFLRREQQKTIDNSERLDKLLQDEGDDDSDFNIDDILESLDKRNK
ncbi:MAG: hypothetical protein ACI4J1_05155 [Ruminiclostridium sp.]